jgi:hypothetical protein
MKRVVKGLVIGFGVLALSAGAFAQDYGRPERSNFQDRDRDRDRDRYWDRERLAREYHGVFYDRLRGDLDRAERARYLREDDFRRFDRARRELREFEGKWARGYFDPRDMDGAIASVARIVEIPALRREDRDNLRDDLGRMRAFRAHMEERREERRY